MASINECDNRMKYERKEFEELLKYMHECYDKMDDGDTDAVYEKDVIIGFGNRIAHAMGGAATYTALEDAITYILEQEYEEYKERLEYYLDSPIDRDYIVQIAKEMFNLFLPDEIIFNNDTNK